MQDTNTHTHTVNWRLVFHHIRTRIAIFSLNCPLRHTNYKFSSMCYHCFCWCWCCCCHHHQWIHIFEWSFQVWWLVFLCSSVTKSTTSSIHTSLFYLFLCLHLASSIFIRKHTQTRNEWMDGKREREREWSGNSTPREKYTTLVHHHSHYSKRCL